MGAGLCCETEGRTLSWEEARRKGQRQRDCGMEPRPISESAKNPYTCTRQAGMFPTDVQEGKAMLKRLRFSLKFRKTASGWQFRFAVEYLI